MKTNIGKIDRILRGTAAVAIILLYITKVIEGQTAIIFGVIAIALLYTGFTSFCPCYLRFNINTSEKKKRNKIL